MHRASALVFVLAGVASQAAGQLYLNGGLVYIAGGAGGGNSGGEYEFDSMNTANAHLLFNNLFDTAIPLNLGDNAINVQISEGQGKPYPTGLGLFFSTDSTVYSDFGHVCDLVGYRNDNGFAMVHAGANVPTLGALSPEVPYGGATSFNSGPFVITMTDFTVTNLHGVLTLHVGLAPAPGTAGVLGLGMIAAGRRRR